jgi:hypothetical protein
MRSETTPALRSALGPHHDKTVFTAPDVGLPLLDFEQATCPIPGISANTGVVSTATACNANDTADTNSSNSDASRVMCRRHPQLRVFNGNCDKNTITTSDVDPFPGHPLEFMQAIRPVDARLCSSTNNLPAILPADSDSKCADTVQHALLPQHLAHPFNFCHIAPDVTCTSPAPSWSNTSSCCCNANANDAVNIAIAIAIAIATCNSDFGADTITSERPDTLDNASSNCCCCCCCNNTNGATSNSNSDFNNNASIIGIAHTFNADIATNNSNNSDNDATGFVNTACTLDINDADSNNNSKRLNTPNKIRSDADTFEKRSTTPLIPTVSNTPTHDNEPKHKYIHIPPLGSNLQVPPLVAPQLDKPEELPPAPPMDMMPLCLQPPSRARPLSHRIRFHSRPL